MICLRCGSCCTDMSVMIINPKYVHMKIILDDYIGDYPEDLVILKDTGIECPHLVRRANNNCTCAIHHLDFYKYTPCYEFSQIERSAQNSCRIGLYKTAQYEYNNIIYTSFIQHRQRMQNEMFLS